MKRYPVPHNPGGSLRLFIATGGLFGVCGVILGAIAAHLPAQRYAVPTGQATLHNATEMLMWHALALLGLSAAHTLLSPALGRIAGYAFIIGTVLFVIPVILYALIDYHIGAMSIARIAPYGGTLLILAWVITAIAALKGKRLI